MARLATRRRGIRVIGLLPIITTALVLAACPSPQARPPTEAPPPAATAAAAPDATERATDEATEEATAEPSHPDGAEDDEDAVAELLAHVPESFRDSCTATDQAATIEGAELAVSCRPEGAAGTVPDEVIYIQFATAEPMNAWFTSDVEAVGMVEGDCRMDENVYGPYEIEGEVVGQVSCTLDADGTTIAWTDERLNILCLALMVENPDSAALYEWWTGDSGPIE